MKTTEVDLDKVSGYLKSQVGWVDLDKIRKAIPAKHANGMKIEAMRHLGLLERDGENVKLTTDGRDYAGGDIAKRAEIMRKRLRADSLFYATLESMHFNDKTSVTKTDVANYWPACIFLLRRRSAASTHPVECFVHSRRPFPGNCEPTAGTTRAVGARLGCARSRCSS